MRDGLIPFIRVALRDNMLWVAIATLALLPIASLAVPTEALRPAFVAAAGAFAAALAFRQPRSYLSFLACLFFFAPLARRVIDNSIGYAEPNLVLLAPFVAILVSAPIGLAHVLAGRRFSAPLAVMMVAVWWGGFVGMLNGVLTGAALDGLKWGAPLLLLGYILARPLDDEDRRLLLRHLALFAGLAGAYALVQYALLPEWDRYWMTMSPLGSGPYGILGTPKPFQLRVFGSMNSPHSLSTSLAVAALLTLASRGGGYTVSMVLSAAGILVSLQRSVVALLVPLVGWAALTGTNVTRRRLAGVLALSMAAIVGLLSVSEDSLARVEERFTEQDIAGDESLRIRLWQYSDAAVWVDERPEGRGFGWRSVSDGPVFVLDSGLIDTMMTLGAGPGLLYLFAFGVLVAAACTPAIWRGDFAGCAALAVVFSSVQLFFGFPLIGEHGFFTFLALGLALTARQPQALAAGSNV